MLVTAGASDIGACAIQVARLAGAEVFSTIRNQDDENILVNNLGMQRAPLL